MYSTFHDPNYVLWVLHAIFSPLQGGYVALVYVLDKDLMQRFNFLRDQISCYFCCKHRANVKLANRCDENMISRSEAQLALTEEISVDENQEINRKGQQNYGSTENRLTTSHNV